MNSLPTEVVDYTVKTYLNESLHLGRLGATCKWIQGIVKEHLDVWVRLRDFRVKLSMCETEESASEAVEDFYDSMLARNYGGKTEDQLTPRDCASYCKDRMPATKVYSEWLDANKEKLNGLSLNEILSKDLVYTAFWHELKRRDSNHPRFDIRLQCMENMYVGYLGVYHDDEEVVDMDYDNIQDLCLYLLPSELMYYPDEDFDAWLMYRDSLLNGCRNMDTRELDHQLTETWALESGLRLTLDDVHKLSDIIEQHSLLTKWSAYDRTSVPEVLLDAITIMMRSRGAVDIKTRETLQKAIDRAGLTWLCCEDGSGGGCNAVYQVKDHIMGYCPVCG